MHRRSAGNYFYNGIILSFLGAVCFSTKAIFVKLAYRETTVDAVSLLALRMLFSLPFFIATAWISSTRSSNVRFTRLQWLKVAVIGCLGYYVSSLLDFIGLQYISAGIERLILFIYPTLVLVLCSLFFKQRTSTIHWLAVGITYLGLSFAFYGEIDLSKGGENLVLGSVLVFICAITYAVYIVGSGRLIPLVGAAKFNSYAMGFACVGVLIHFFIQSDHSMFGFSREVYFYAGLMAMISTVVPSYLISEGIKRIGSDNAAIVGSVGPISTIIQAYYFLNEPFLMWQVLGTALVLGGILLISRKSRTTGL
jgi:drug/metabolite transporter (DMT)-like permease